MKGKTNQTKEKEKLMVWHIPQIPGKPFNVPVSNIDEAKKVLRILADYDSFQFQNNIKPDYSNVSGLQRYEDNEWYEWYDENGDGIWSFMGDYPSIMEQEKRLKYE